MHLISQIYKICYKILNLNVPGRNTEDGQKDAFEIEVTRRKEIFTFWSILLFLKTTRKCLTGKWSLELKLGSGRWPDTMKFNNRFGEPQFFAATTSATAATTVHANVTATTTGTTRATASATATARSIESAGATGTSPANATATRTTTATVIATTTANASCHLHSEILTSPFIYASKSRWSPSYCGGLDQKIKNKNDWMFESLKKK